jgi:hypothetical protein
MSFANGGEQLLEARASTPPLHWPTFTPPRWPEISPPLTSPGWRKVTILSSFMAYQSLFG